jgi:hypothetical protein
VTCCLDAIRPPEHARRSLRCHQRPTTCKRDDLSAALFHLVLNIELVRARGL